MLNSNSCNSFEMNKIDHVAFAVRSLEQSIPVFEKLLKTPCYKSEEVHSQQVITAFFKSGESKIELLQSTDENGTIARFLEKKGEGMHHLAFAVDNLADEMSRLKAEGFFFLQEEPIVGADNKWIAFLHPKCTQGVLVELCQEIPT